MTTLSLIPPSDVDELLTGYVSGRLTGGLGALARAHLRLDREARHLAQAGECIGGAALEAEAIAPLGEAAVSGTVSRLEPTGVGKPANQIEHAANSDVFQDLLGHPLERVRWRMRLPGVHEYRLQRFHDRYSDTKLIRLHAGRRMPEHGHHGAEITLVLKGAYHDQTGDYTRGDVQFIDRETSHQPTASSQSDCICLIVSFGGIKVHRPLEQMWRYFFH